MSLAKIRTQQTRALVGAWVGEDKHGLEGVSFKVRGRFNPDARALEARLGAAVPKSGKLSNGSWTPEEAERITNELVVEAILIDWDGVRETEESEPIPYSKERARELISDPVLRPFRDAILMASVMVAEEGRETLEADAKN